MSFTIIKLHENLKRMEAKEIELTGFCINPNDIDKIKLSTMNAKELRLNNLIFDDNGDVTKVFVLSNYGSCEINDDIMSGRYKPIPLTEEWLVKFRFVNFVIEYTQNTSFYVCIDENNGFANEGKLLIIQDGAPMFSSPCKYVHQLQNLYFALTGEELEVK